MRTGTCIPLRRTLVVRPRSPDVWGLIIGAIAVISVIFVLQEVGLDGNMFMCDDDSVPPPEALADDADAYASDPGAPVGAPIAAAPLSKSGAPGAAGGAAKRTVHRLRYLLHTLPESMYFCYRSFNNAAVDLQAVTWGGRFTILAFGLFLLVTITVYQSALTTMMVNYERVATIEDIQQGIQLGMKFCAQRVNALHVQRLYPAATFITDPADGEVGLQSRSDVFALMDAGQCDLGISYGQDLEREHGSGLHCQKMMVRTHHGQLHAGMCTCTSLLSRARARACPRACRSASRWRPRLRASRSRPAWLTRSAGGCSTPSMAASGRRSSSAARPPTSARPGRAASSRARCG